MPCGRLNAPATVTGLPGKSCDVRELADHPDWALDYIIAPPQMAHYIAAQHPDLQRLP